MCLGKLGVLLDYKISHRCALEDWEFYGIKRLVMDVPWKTGSSVALTD